MCCGYLLMPFWKFIVATALGKGVVKVNGQAVFFVIIFGSSFFQVVKSGLDSFSAVLQGFIGKDFVLGQRVEQVRNKLIRKFEMQSRFKPEKLMGERTFLDATSIKELFAKNDDAEDIAKRVLSTWDKNRDG